MTFVTDATKGTLTGTGDTATSSLVSVGAVTEGTSLSQLMSDHNITATAKTGYKFEGWSLQGSTTIDNMTGTVSSDLTYVATYTEVDSEWVNITFVSGDHGTFTYNGKSGLTTITTKKVLKGTTFSEAGFTLPIIDANAHYTANGFDKTMTSSTAINENMTITAQYTADQYTITFKDEDGTTLKSSKVTYGDMPTCDAPEKADTAQYDYTFAGWDKTIVAASEDATYTATYTKTVKSYKVIFDPQNGGDNQESTVTYGDYASWNSATPAKASDQEYKYEFLGWYVKGDDTQSVVDLTKTPVTGKVTYLAKYKAIKQTYTVEYYESTDDSYTLAGDQLTSTDTYEYGTQLLDKAAQTKKASAKYMYTFIGWNITAGTTVQNNLKILANYEATINKYQITFLNYDNTVLQQSNVAYDETPVYEGATPEKASDAQYSYTFKGWDKEISAVTGATTYVATYKKTLRSYKITFKNEDGTILDTKTLDYGSSVTYDAKTPTKESTVQYDYTFKGWDKALATVTGDATYTATFTAATRNYTVKFTNEDGTVLQTSSVAYGDTAIYGGKTPEKAKTAEYTYTFDGWNKAITAVEGDQTYIATYKATKNQYTVRFIDGDSNILDTQTLSYGATPSYQGTPTKSATAQYSYTFKGWDQAITAVTGDVDYTAQFDRSINSYTITFKDYNGDVLDTQTLKYGETPVHNKADPTRSATSTQRYVFDGWDKELSTVTGDATYTATYKAINLYNVSFYESTDDSYTLVGNTKTSETVVDEGSSVTPPLATLKTNSKEWSYTFLGWDTDTSNITSNTVVKAQYAATKNKYTITFVDEDGTTLQSSDVAYGETPVYTNTSPAKASDDQYDYTFAGWDKDITAVTDQATYTATYKKTVRKYTITFVDKDGTVLKKAEVAYGETPTCDDPYKAADAQYTYSFAGWDQSIKAVTGNATYTATYSQKINTYKITFINEDGTVLETQEVAYGETPVYGGKTPVKESTIASVYTFDTWDQTIQKVTGPAIYTATYKETSQTYKVTFVDYDGTVLDTQTVKYGEAAVSPSNPTREGYTFTGWDVTYDRITKDITVTALYSENPVVLPATDTTTPVNPTTVIDNATTTTTRKTTTASATTATDNANDNTAGTTTDSTTDITDNPTAKASITSASQKSWALVNFISMALTVLLGIFIIFARSRKERDDEQPKKKYIRYKVIGTVIAIGSVILFFMTENMKLSMVMTDKYTLMMIIIGVIQFFFLMLNLRDRNVDDHKDGYDYKKSKAMN